MSGKRRKTNSGITISLFSFQDIITSLSGIMILLVLLITVDIVTGRLVDPLNSSQLEKKTEEDINSENFSNKELRRENLSNKEIGNKNINSEEDALKKEIENLERYKLQSSRELSDYQIKKEELEQQLTRLTEKKKSFSRPDKNISFIPAKDDNSNMRALLIECSRESIRTGMIDYNLKIPNDSSGTTDENKKKDNSKKKSESKIDVCIFTPSHTYSCLNVHLFPLKNFYK
ncbi:MAG: hypothetical protein HQK67_09690, partial [Desulfamplus sp.]|nr:hypothetical protein [Desulfamplus sp.]